MISSCDRLASDNVDVDASDVEASEGVNEAVDDDAVAAAEDEEEPEEEVADEAVVEKEEDGDINDDEVSADVDVDMAGLWGRRTFIGRAAGEAVCDVDGDEAEEPGVPRAGGGSEASVGRQKNSIPNRCRTLQAARMTARISGSDRRSENAGASCWSIISAISGKREVNSLPWWMARTTVAILTLHRQNHRHDEWTHDVGRLVRRMWSTTSITTNGAFGNNVEMSPSSRNDSANSS